MMTKTFNLSQIMTNAWKMFRQSEMTFGEALKKAWENAKSIISAIKNSLVEEEVHTWYSWKMMGFEVIHESVALFKVTVNDPKTKSGTRVLSYFGKSQVAPIAE